MTQLIEPKLTLQNKENSMKNKEEAKKKLQSKKSSPSPNSLPSKPKTPIKKFFEEDSDDSDEATLVMNDDFIKSLKGMFNMNMKKSINF